MDWARGSDILSKESFSVIAGSLLANCNFFAHLQHTENIWAWTLCLTLTYLHGAPSFQAGGWNVQFQTLRTS